jgi:alpha-galactosidase
LTWAGVFQGEGLLIVDPGTGSEVVSVGGASAADEIPVVRCRVEAARRVVVAADSPVVVARTAAAGGIEGAKAAFADRFAAASGVGPLRPAPTIWCSWYRYFTEVTEADIGENVAAIGARELPVDVIQIDDGYQTDPGDWTSLSSRFHSLPALVDRIRAAGRRAGIWTAPFLVGARSHVAAEHPDWIVRTEGGAPAPVLPNWGQETHPLDVTHPVVREHLASVFEWFAGIGIDFFKLDFLFAAALDGVRHDPSLTSCQAYRQALAGVRAAVGSGAYLLGCGAPLLPSVGLVDAMRIGADTSRAWEPAGGDMSMPGGAAAELSVRGRSYQHGRYWVNDPDCLLLGPDVEQRERRAAMAREHGGLRGLSDRVADLDAWGLAAARELLATVPPATPFTAPS